MEQILVVQDEAARKADKRKKQNRIAQRRSRSKAQMLNAALTEDFECDPVATQDSNGVEFDLSIFGPSGRLPFHATHENFCTAGSENSFSPDSASRSFSHPSTAPYTNCSPRQHFPSDVQRDATLGNFSHARPMSSRGSISDWSHVFPSNQPTPSPEHDYLTHHPSIRHHLEQRTASTSRSDSPHGSVSSKSALPVAQISSTPPIQTPTSPFTYETLEDASALCQSLVPSMTPRPTTAPIDLTNDGSTTMLHIAACAGQEMDILSLLSLSLDVNVKDDSGGTALHSAVRGRQEGAMKLLLSRGADVNACDHEGWTPAALAAKRGFVDGLRILVQWGASLRVRCEGVYKD